MPPRDVSTAAVVVAILAAVGLGVALGGGLAPFDDGDDPSPAAVTDACNTTSVQGTSSPTVQATPSPTVQATPSPTPQVHQRYDHTSVTVCDAGTDAELGRLGVAIADNGSLRYTGLSDTESLPDDRGMLFTYDSEQELTYVMRDMSFGIDIVYVGANRTITSIHHAPKPGPNENGNAQEYPGTGQYVLEVNYKWTEVHDVEVGDRLEFELPE